MKSSLLAVGLMSGTSADGIDAALVWVDRFPRRVSLLHEWEIPHPEPLRKRILAAAGSELNTGALSELHATLGKAFGRAVVELCEQAGEPLSDVDIIGSHGQTVWHAPEQGASLQLGDPAHIAEICRVPVVSDFRTADLAAGGQGAPLVPLLHHALFADPKRHRAVVNIGGIANITHLPAGATTEQVQAFDSGPGNMLLDALVGHFTQGREKMDRDGAMAERGQVNEPLLSELLANPYFARRGPKSTGREQFGAGAVARIVHAGEGLSEADILATVTTLTARTIADGIAAAGPVDDVLICGGGAKNRTLVAMLSAALGPDVTVFATDRAGVSSSALEAMAFAELACRHLWGEPGNLVRVTGASGPRVLGRLTPSPNPN